MLTCYSPKQKHDKDIVLTKYYLISKVGDLLIMFVIAKYSILIFNLAISNLFPFSIPFRCFLPFRFLFDVSFLFDVYPDPKHPFYHLLTVLGVPIIIFSQLRKMMPALTFNFIIAATNAWRGKWNRHALVPSDNFFTHFAIFFWFVRKCKKMKIQDVHCPMRKLWRTSLRSFGQNNMRISKKWDTWGRLH